MNAIRDRGPDLARTHPDLPFLRVLRASVVSIALAVPAEAGAQTLFKCVNANGKTTYQQEPCVDAKQSTVRLPDPVAAKTPEQVKAAQEKGAKDNESAMDRVGNMLADVSLCQSDVPGFDEKHSAALQGWKQRNGADVDKFYKDPAAQSRAVTRRDAERARIGADKNALAARCEQIAASLGAAGPATAARK